ncbi:sugar transferase [Candidatus Sumerlaeota bacterium]|nr:sugar transferase [Candidatus Sumerlaeota bacterium]
MNGQEHARSIWKTRWVSVALMLVDAIGFAMCWMGAYYFRASQNHWTDLPINDVAPYMRVLPLIVMMGVLNALTFGLYIHRRRLSSLNRPSTMLKAGYHWIFYIIVVAFLFKELDLGRSVIVIAGLFGFVYLYASRNALRWLKARALTTGSGRVRCIIVGSGEHAREVRGFLSHHPEVGFEIIGWVARNESDLGGDEAFLGTADNLKDIVHQHHVEEVFLAIANLETHEQINLVNEAEISGVNVNVVSNLFDVISEQRTFDEVGSYPVVTLRDGQRPVYQRIMKSLIDYALGLVGFVSWILFFHWWIAIMIKSDSRGPVLFSQDRVGKGGKRFRIWKYRTMQTNAPTYAVAPTEENDPRITRFGRWLRKTSLDEMPQLLNVLRGDMSVVGPRPEMPFIVEQYEPWQRRRLDVKPGLTGLWQVIGRKNLPLHLNMQYDLYYIKNQSILLDIEILLRTIPAVLKGKGAF